MEASDGKDSAEFDTDHPLLKTRETLNPYRAGLGLLARRLLWDLNPKSWQSGINIKRWKELSRKYGEKAVILCNGTSLNKVDFSLLKDTFLLGLKCLQVPISLH